jgi:hypothetical protein
MYDSVVIEIGFVIITLGTEDTELIECICEGLHRLLHCLSGISLPHSTHS